MITGRNGNTGVQRPCNNIALQNNINTRQDMSNTYSKQNAHLGLLVSPEKLVCEHYERLSKYLPGLRPVAISKIDLTTVHSPKSCHRISRWKDRFLFGNDTPPVDFNTEKYKSTNKNSMKNIIMIIITISTRPRITTLIILNQEIASLN